MRSQGALLRVLVAGAVTGMLGVVVFGAAHAIIIVPIWTRLLGGIPFGVGAGLAMGWAFQEAQTVRWPFRRSSRGLQFGFLMWLTLIPATACGAIFRLTGIHSQHDTWELVAELLAALGTGAATGRAMGGPIPVTTSARAAWLFVAFAAIYSSFLPWDVDLLKMPACCYISTTAMDRNVRLVGTHIHTCTVLFNLEVGHRPSALLTSVRL